MERIVAAAARLPSGEVFIGPTHADAFDAAGVEWEEAECGFVTSEGRFVTKQVAREIARAARQVVGGRQGDLDSGELPTEN